MNPYVMLFLSSALAGCTTMPGGYDPSKLTAEQIKAAVADKSTTAACGMATSIHGRATTVYVNLDSSRTLANGTVTIDPECKTTITLTQPARAASAP